ncbi:site-specific integrase [Labrenzia sp. 011]|uniref:site-specific integrase n=1 Tax=Labrenzia sp. 011 TaxID=2171494 RepID=UPI00140420E4|nr:site-specific integrase [Labrenzia sp. 011]
MSKPRYLTKDTKGRKLRRPVPQDIQKYVGKTAWVERLGSLSWSDAVERAHLFAVETDTEIKRYRKEAQRAQSPALHIVDEPGCNFSLMDHEVDQLALVYFHRRERDAESEGGYLLDDNDPRFNDLLSDAQHDLGDALNVQKGVDIGLVDGSQKSKHWTCLNLLVKHGYLGKEAILTENGKRYPTEVISNQRFQRLCKLIVRADVERARRVVEAMENGQHPSLSDSFFASALKPGFELEQPLNRSRKTIGDLVRSYRARREKEVGSSRLSQHNIVFRVLEEELGNATLLTNVARDQCQQLADLFVHIPPHVSQHYKSKKLRQAVEAYEAINGNKPNRVSEGRKNLAILQKAFDHAVRQEWIDRNPASNVEIVGPKRAAKYSNSNDGYQPFSTEELQRIFSAPLYTGCLNDEHGATRSGPHIIKRHRYWAPLLALWTGMRMNEILQLEKGDLRQADRIWYVSVNDTEEIDYEPDTFVKRLKNKNSERDIPLHPELIRFGFIDWADKQDKGRLFPEASQGLADKPSTMFSKRFKTFLTSLDILVPRKKVFHSFRSNFNDALREAGVPQEFRVAINGWTEQNAMDGRYGKGYKVRQLYEEIQKVKYPSLDLRSLYQAEH